MKLFFVVMLVLVGSVVMVPIFVAIGPDRMPGDFMLTLQGHQYAIPVLYSLCASAALGLLYWLMIR